MIAEILEPVAETVAELTAEKFARLLRLFIVVTSKIIAEDMIEIN